jgi:hypothetical protein
MREARRWRDILTVLVTTPPLSKRRPGDRLLKSIAEKTAIWQEAHDRLRQKDPGLYAAVQRVCELSWKRRAAMSYQEYKADMHRRIRRIEKLREEMRTWGLKTLAPN